jgi:hypothetical protein
MSSYALPNTRQIAMPGAKRASPITAAAICTTHYTSTDSDGSQLIALNCRMAPISEIDGIAIRHFDGRDSWRYLEQ